MIKKRPFRFGVLNETMLSRQHWITQARKAEDLGYATFLIRDHFVPDFGGDTFSPTASLMTAANVTQTLRTGTLVIDNDFRHPVVLAKEVATLDQMSDGRFELGLGAGWLQVEYEQMGIPFDPPGVRVSRLEEAISVFKAFFTQDQVDFTGQYYTVNGLKSFPKPVQRPHPPLLIGAGKKRMCQIAGREADIVSLLTVSTSHGTFQADPAELLGSTIAQKLNWVREGAGERFPEIELSMMISIFVTEDRQQCAQQLIREQNWHNISVEQVLNMPPRFIGSVDQIVEQMEMRRKQYGFSYYIISDKTMEIFAPIVAQLAGK
jgi:probable F420-dependent oxidoreductase